MNQRIHVDILSIQEYNKQCVFFLLSKEGDAINITKIIAGYISDNHLTVSQISLDTGIEMNKLMPDSQKKLSSQELLVLCSYLHIKPEELTGMQNADL